MIRSATTGALYTRRAGRGMPARSRSGTVLSRAARLNTVCCGTHRVPALSISVSRATRRHSDLRSFTSRALIKKIVTFSAGNGGSIQREIGMTWRPVKQLTDAAQPEELFTGQWQNRPSILDQS